MTKPTPHSIAIGEALLAYRRRFASGQALIAVALGTSAGTISLLENGRSGVPAWVVAAAEEMLKDGSHPLDYLEKLVFGKREATPR